MNPRLTVCHLTGRDVELFQGSVISGLKFFHLPSNKAKEEIVVELLLLCVVSLAASGLSMIA